MTMVELLLTLVVVIGGGVWLLYAYQGMLQLTEVSQQTSVALNDLDDMMEAVHATPFSQLSAVFPHNTAGVSAYATIIGGYTLPGEQITVLHHPDTSADPRELEVRVSWTNQGRSYQRTLFTMRTDQTA